jgi:hypothetical protein
VATFAYLPWVREGLARIWRTQIPGLTVRSPATGMVAVLAVARIWRYLPDPGCGFHMLVSHFWFMGTTHCRPIRSKEESGKTREKYKPTSSNGLIMGKKAKFDG